MKPVLFFIFSILLIATRAYSASCCLGGSPKSFISLQRLETYEIGISSSYRDVFAQFDRYGELVETNRNQTLSTSLGAGIRLSDSLQAALIIPWIYQRNQLTRDVGTRSNIGDILASANYLVMESLFQDEWYPTVSLSAGIKVPTGVSDTLSGKLILPGTGNGAWEPFVGLGAQKWLGAFLFTIRGSFTARLKAGPVDGDSFDLSESVMLALTPRLSLAAGSSQNWTLRIKKNNGLINDSEGRAASLFLSPTYFLSRFLSLSAGYEETISFTTAGVNQPAARTFTLTARYGFY